MNKDCQVTGLHDARCLIPVEMTIFTIFVLLLSLTITATIGSVNGASDFDC